METLLNLIIKEGQHDFNKSGVMVVDTIEELEGLDAKIYGNLVYVNRQIATIAIVVQVMGRISKGLCRA